MDLRAVDLNLLVALDVLLEERHVTRAAERLALSQPATTAQLQRLRRLFSDDLLARNGRGFLRTPLADALVEPVKEALSGVGAVFSVRPGFDPVSDHRTFSILASDYVAVVLIRPLIATLIAEAPHVRIRLLPVGDDWHTALRRSEVDFVLMPEALVTEHYADLPRHALFEDEYVCAACRLHPSIDGTITLEQLCTLPYAQYGAADRVSLADASLERAGIQTNVEVMTETMISLPYLLSGTRLVALVLRRLAERVAPSAGIQLMAPPVAIPPVVEALAWHPRHTADPAHRWLRERVAELARAL